MNKTLGLLIILSAVAGAKEFRPVQQVAQAGSLIGANLLNDSLYANPASSAFSRVYSIDTSFHTTQDFSVSVLDTKTGVVGGGLAYFRTSNPWFPDTPMQGMKLAMSGRLTQGLGVGVTGKMLWGNTNPSSARAGAEHKIYDADVGLMANLGIVQIGSVVRNVLGGSADLNEESEWAVGARIGYQQMLFLNAAVYSPLSEVNNPNQYAIGVEYVSAYKFALKAGYRNLPRTNESFWGVGAGINSPKVSFHYGLEIPNQEGDLAHTLAVNALF